MMSNEIMSSKSVVNPSSGFEAFGLDPVLMRAIGEAGFDQPRPIQRAAIAELLAGRDCLGLAQTGTGKTAAFALPILHRLKNQRPGAIRALVLAPTRELVRQIENEFRVLGRHLPLRTLTIFGGVSQRIQMDGLRRRPDIIIACPGRLLDLMNQRLVHLNDVEMLVLDEADHMFDMGFLADIKRILAALPAKRQNMLFSATMPREIRGLANQVLNDPHVVELSSVGPAETIDHALYSLAETDKLNVLQNLLKGSDFSSAIVFSRTKHRARRLASTLADQGHRAIALQGNMSQAQRDRAMDGFRQKRFNVLVATDIASRGIDVANVSHVINYDVPNTPEAYTHRIGRTGRAEQSGKAFTFVTREDSSAIRDIERRLGKAIPRLSIDGKPLPAEQLPARPAGDEPRRFDSRSRRGPGRSFGRPGQRSSRFSNGRRSGSDRRFS